MNTTTAADMAAALRKAAELLNSAADMAAAGELGLANEAWLDAADMLAALDEPACPKGPGGSHTVNSSDVCVYCGADLS